MRGGDLKPTTRESLIRDFIRPGGQDDIMKQERLPVEAAQLQLYALHLEWVVLDCLLADSPVVRHRARELEKGNG